MSSSIYLFSISSHPGTIQINPLTINFFKSDVDFSKYDNFIITSKQISKILSFYEVKTDDLKPALCISKQSAKSYKAIGGEVLEVGKGYGDDLCSSISNYSKETKWLYLRAKEVASDFVEVLREDGYCIDETILYESRCSESLKNLSFEENAKFIFTSPSSVKCFLKESEIPENAQVIVIGKTTAKALPKNINYTISQEKTIQSCVDSIQTN